MVSFVLLVEAADVPRLPDALASLRGQWYALFEVLVCPVGSAHVSLDPVGGDPRFRVVAAQPTWQEAAQHAARRARGDYLWFVRGCDTLTAHAATDLAGALARSGSDLATGILLQQGQPESWLSRAQLDAHRDPQRGLAAAARPGLAGDLVVGNKLLRAAFWRTCAGFGEQDDWLNAPALALALRRARVDVLDVPVARHAHEHGHRPFGALPSPLPELPGWRRSSQAVEEALAGSPLIEGWHRHVLDVALPRFLADTERADDEQWHELVAASRRLRDQHPSVLASVRAESRALLWLAAHERRTELVSLSTELFGLADDLPTRLVDGELLACWASMPQDLPVETRLLTDAESPLEAKVQRVFAAADGTVVADVFVRVRLLDLADLDFTIAAELPDGTVLEVEPRPDATAERWSRSRFQSAAPGGIRLRLPAGSEPQLLRLTLSSGGFHREGSVLVEPAGDEPRRTALPTVHAVSVVDDDLVLRFGSVAPPARLTGPGGIERVGTPAAADLRFDTNADLFGRAVGLPSGRYRLGHEVAVAAELAAALPLEIAGRRHRVRVHHEDQHLLFDLGPPLADDEIGPYAQERLRRDYAAATGPTDADVCYFETYAGRSATDSPLAIFEELSSRRPELRIHWGVLDHGQWTPPGAHRVILRSRAWYDVLARARLLVTNTELEDWYVRRPDQFVVQTFHGYPSKAMGESQWRARQLPPSRIAAMRARSVATWDLILTPTPEMTRHYREQYGYTGAAHEHGYPRDDALRAPGAGTRREETRSLLGIEEGQTVVLYAPTWRDHLASRPRAAAMADFLDLRRAASALGRDHVLLVRGHRFHQASSTQAPDPAAARVLDVTGHPEINDLILASDAAVLDYSSLRFDYAQTGKPMVFLVPDLDSYAGGVRGFLYPFTDSAPGPLLTTTDEVVAAVRDLNALRQEWQAELAAFDATYNPWQDGRAASRAVDLLLSSTHLG